MSAQPLPGEQPWIPAPIEGGLFWPRRKIFGGEAKWTAYRGAHQPCGTCVEVLQDHDREPYDRDPPHPSPATQKRQGPNGPTLHCARHASDLKLRDDEVSRRLAAQRVHNAHMQRGRRR